MAEVTAIYFTALQDPMAGELSIRLVTGATTPSDLAVDAVRDYTVEYVFDPHYELQSFDRAFRFFAAKFEALSGLDPQVGRRIAHRIAFIAYRCLHRLSRRYGRHYGLSVWADLQTGRAGEQDEQAPAAAAEVNLGNIVFDDGGDRSGECCSVCLEDFEREEVITQLSLCLHKFHNECIAKWLRRKRTCPICRGRV